MPNTLNRNYRISPDSDVDWHDALNDLARDVDADVADLALSGIGGTGAIVTVKDVPANREIWTDAGIVLTGTDALTIEAFGKVTHQPNVPLYDIASSQNLQLNVVIVPDGVTPVGDMPGQFLYRLPENMSRKTGRVWVRLGDLLGLYPDNSGTATATFNYYADAAKAVAPSVLSLLPSNVIGLVNALQSEAAARAQRDDELEVYIEDSVVAEANVREQDDIDLQTEISKKLPLAGGTVTGQARFAGTGSAQDNLSKYAALIRPNGPLSPFYGGLGIADKDGNLLVDVDGSGNFNLKRSLTLPFDATQVNNLKWMASDGSVLATLGSVGGDAAWLQLKKLNSSFQFINSDFQNIFIIRDAGQVSFGPGGNGSGTMQVNSRNPGIPVLVLSGKPEQSQPLIQLEIPAADFFNYAAGYVHAGWPDNTVAARRGRAVVGAFDLFTQREGFRVDALAGGAAGVGFYGAAAVAKQTVNAAATDAASALALVNQLRDTLRNLGLIQ